jgi:hypothetical protein
MSSRREPHPVHGRRAAASAAVLLVAAAGAVVGCGPSKVAECNRLVEVVNTGVASLDQGMKATSDPTGVANLRSMAEAMEKAAADAEKVELTIAELKDYSKRYQTMARDVAKSARDMAAAVDAKDNAKMTAAQNAMENAVKTEDPLVESINKFCGGS